jgi:hypothetical protein
MKEIFETGARVRVPYVFLRSKNAVALKVRA